jgi:hypothetical protein
LRGGDIHLRVDLYIHIKKDIIQLESEETSVILSLGRLPAGLFELLQLV